MLKTENLTGPATAAASNQRATTKGPIMNKTQKNVNAAGGIVNKSNGNENGIIVQLAPADLCRGPNNRPNGSGLSEESLQELAGSIREKGIVQPLIVRPGSANSYEIVAGERRWRAAKLAKLESVPCIVREVNDREALELRAIENLQREGLHPIEEAKGYAELLALRDPEGKPCHTVDSLAAKIGKSSNAIYGRLKLLKLPQVAVAGMLDGKLSASTAELIGRIPDPKLRQKAALEILCGDSWEWRLKEDRKGEWEEMALDPDEEAMTFREAKEHVQEHYMRRLKACGFNLKDAELVPMEELEGERIAGGACADCPWRTGNMIDQLTISMEGSPDVCTNPACFQRKKTASWKRDQAKAKAEGQTLLPEKQAARLFDGDGELGWHGKRAYVDLRAAVPGEKKKKWEDVLPENLPAPIIQARDGRSKMHCLVPLAAAAEAMKASGRKVPQALKEAQQACHDPEIERQRQEARAQAKKRSQAIAEHLAGLVLERAKAEPDDRWWQWIAEQVMPSYAYESSRLFIGSAERKTAANCRAHLVACVAFGHLADWDGSIDGDLLKTCEFYGVDHKAVIKQKAAELKSAEKAAARALQTSAPPN